MRHGSFSSLEALKNKLSQFVEYFNKTFAKPFEWTYTGRPTKAKTRPRPFTWREGWARKAKAGQDLALVA